MSYTDSIAITPPYPYWVSLQEETNGPTPPPENDMFEDGPIYAPTPAPPPENYIFGKGPIYVPTPAPPPENGKLLVWTLAGIFVGAIVGMSLLVALGVFFILRRRQRMSSQDLQNHSVEAPAQGLSDKPSSGQPQHWKQNAPPPPPPPPPPDNKVTMLPKSSPSPGISSNPHQPPVHDPAFLEPPSTSRSLVCEKQLHQSPSPRMALGFSLSTFTYEELAEATDGFSDANRIGEGGFGYVYKGVLRNGTLVPNGTPVPNETPVAIKQLKAGSGQGEREFQAEVEIISRVHHRHLVSLVGYCVTGAQRMLVYEFVPNNTLEFHLHGKGRPVFNWPIRMKISLGSAKGLAYLHEDCRPKIIHRDIKAANILIDDSFEPKVADFGLARFALDTDTQVFTQVLGSHGYMAPEYASFGKLTDKSDVFSFGVVLLELITGRPPVNRTHSFVDDIMVDWAKPLLTRALEDGNFDSLVDPRLQKEYDSNEMARVVACAASCVRHSARSRPRMSQIVRALEGNMALDGLNEGVIPGYSTVFSSSGDSDYNSSQYREDLQKFKKMALETQEHGCSVCSGSTSEYGLNQSSSSTEGQQTTQEFGCKIDIHC